MRNFFEKIKSDSKLRMQATGIGLTVLIAVTAAVAIPVGVHSNNVKKALAAEQAAITAESDVSEAASAAVSEPETEELTEAATEPTTAETTAQAGDNSSNTNKGSASNTSKGGSSGKSSDSVQKPNSGSSGSQGQKNPPAQQEEPAAPVQKENYDWSQAEVDALIAEAYAYGRTLGLEPATNLTPDNSSWRQPVCTWLGKQNTVDGVKGQIKNIKRIAEREGWELDGTPCYQIYTERYYEAAAGGYCWQFYVMR